MSKINPFPLENNNKYKISGIKQRTTEGEPYGGNFFIIDINRKNIFFLKF